MNQGQKSRNPDAIYDWAVRKEIGVKPSTARALQALVDYASTGKAMPVKTKERWKKVGTFKDEKVTLTKEQMEGDTVSWILLALVYEGLVEQVAPSQTS